MPHMCIIDLENKIQQIQGYFCNVNNSHVCYMEFDFVRVCHIRVRERSGSVVECLTRDQRAAGSSLTGVTALCP